jgi:hypothetical protein
MIGLMNFFIAIEKAVSSDFRPCGSTANLGKSPSRKSATAAGLSFIMIPSARR